jgi:site-specific DNA-methyltransferase (adenine-specific)
VTVRNKIKTKIKKGKKMESKKIIMMPLGSIKPYENNPRHNESAVDMVAQSIKDFGFKNPIIVDKDNVIIAGHTRLKAAYKLGLTAAPVIVADDLDEDKVKAFRLVDNRTAEVAAWDFAKLEEELKNIEMPMEAFDFNFEDMGFEPEEEEPKDVIEDEVPEVDEVNEPTTKLGYIWQLGEHRLMCGDSTSREDVEKLMDGKQADMVVTDPPYNVAYEGGTEDHLTIQNDNMESEEFRKFLTSAFERMAEALKEGASFYIWYANLESYNFIGALNDANLTIRQFLIWNKNALVLGRSDYQWKHEPCLYGWKDGASHNWYGDRSQTTVLDFDKPSRNGEHPTMKPIALFDYQIRNSSKKGDVVLDLFGGSGTTIIACEQNGRKGYSMELDPKYCDVIIKRWETLTGEKAVLLNG